MSLLLEKYTLFGHSSPNLNLDFDNAFIINNLIKLNILDGS